MCSDLWQKNFDVLRSEITLNKVYLECEDTVKSKPNGNDSDFITYWKKTNFTGKWLNNSGYIITQWGKISERIGYHMFQKIGKNQKSDQGWLN